jgi:hypothetical protein
MKTSLHVSRRWLHSSPPSCSTATRCPRPFVHSNRRAVLYPCGDAPAHAAARQGCPGNRGSGGPASAATLVLPPALASGFVHTDASQDPASACRAHRRTGAAGHGDAGAHSAARRNVRAEHDPSPDRQRSARRPRADTGWLVKQDATIWLHVLRLHKCYALSTQTGHNGSVAFSHARTDRNAHVQRLVQASLHCSGRCARYVHAFVHGQMRALSLAIPAMPLLYSFSRYVMRDGFRGAFCERHTEGPIPSFLWQEHGPPGSLFDRDIRSFS